MNSAKCRQSPMSASGKCASTGEVIVSGSASFFIRKRREPVQSACGGTGSCTLEKGLKSGLVTMRAISTTAFTLSVEPAASISLTSLIASSPRLLRALT